MKLTKLKLEIFIYQYRSAIVCVAFLIVSLSVLFLSVKSNTNLNAGPPFVGEVVRSVKMSIGSSKLTLSPYVLTITVGGQMIRDVQSYEFYVPGEKVCVQPVIRGESRTVKTHMVVDSIYCSEKWDN